MSIKPRIAPNILLSISSLYNDTNRIFMEYVDNSIDSADQNFFSIEQNGYSKPIEIVVKIEGNNYKDGRVTIFDNCFGITNFTKVVRSIGWSDKVNQRKKQGFYINGQFGYGIYSFMAACESMCISSREATKDALYLPINRAQFNKETVEEVTLPDLKIIKDFPFETGTIVSLSHFDKDMWRLIDSSILKREIERHFELILKRKNLTIKIVNNTGNESLCVPFDYDLIEGEIYEDYIKTLIKEKEGNQIKLLKFDLKDPVHIFLKMTDGTTIDKAPVFISRGRRICEIKDVKSFKSTHKSDIWGHPNVTGYIDLKGTLPPTIARDDFKNTKESRMIFNELKEIEDIVLDFVKRTNQHSEQKHYQQLEDVLNKALSRLARIDSMNFRTDYLRGGDINLGENGAGKALEVGGGPDESGNGGNGEGDGIGENDGTGLHPEGEGKELATDKDGGDMVKMDEQFEDSDNKGKERKKSGFNIRIAEGDPVTDEKGKQKRSILAGSEIVVYKNHPDFQARVAHTRQGEAKINERLITYLAGEITVHYKDEFYKKIQNGQPEYNKDMFESVVSFIYQFEEMLMGLVGKNLSEME